jgi:hypothetical protein
LKYRVGAWRKSIRPRRHAAGASNEKKSITFL